MIDILDAIGTVLYFILILVLLPILIIAYVIGGILDLTYFERHAKEYQQPNACPYFVEGEERDA